MASLRWDRLLDTCLRERASDLLLTAGSHPMIRLRASWRALSVAPLDAAAVQALAYEALGAKPDGEAEGCAFSDFSYDVWRFRATAFGHPDTKLLLVAKYPSKGEDQQPPRAAV